MNQISTELRKALIADSSPLGYAMEIDVVDNTLCEWVKARRVRNPYRKALTGSQSSKRRRKDA
jgi:hypothetical protein